MVACRNGVISIEVLDGILIRGLMNKSACDFRIVRTRWSERSLDRIGEDLRSLSLYISSHLIHDQRDVRFGDKSLHAKLAKCPKHQESVLDKQFLSGDRSTHGVQTSFSLFCTFHRWRSVHVGDIEGFSVRYMNWDVGFSELGRRAVLSDISG